MQDFRYALAQIRRAPAFAMAAILTLALGIGANTAIIAVQHLLNTPVPYEDPSRVVLLVRTVPGSGQSVEPKRDVADAVRARADVFESASFYARASFTLSQDSGPEQLEGAQIAPDLLTTLGMHPLFGRGFTAEDTARGAPAVALISHGLWQGRFGGTRDVIGRVIRIDDQPTTIVGVLPFGFTLPWTNADQFWMPLRFSGPQAATDMIARLRRGVTADRAAREVKQIVEGFEPRTTTPATALGTTVVAVNDFFGELWGKSGLRTALLVLLAAVGVVLLIACANIANLVLARAWGRQREFAIRAALGAGRGRLVRLVLVESLVLAAIGGVIGAFLGWRLLQLIIDLHPSFLTELTGVRLDATVLGIVLVIATLSGFAFGLAPALFAGNARVALALNAQSRTASGGARARLFRSALVMTEVAFSVVLLVCAALLVRSMIALGRVDPGVNPRGLSAVSLTFPSE